MKRVAERRRRESRRWEEGSCSEEAKGVAEFVSEKPNEIVLKFHLAVRGTSSAEEREDTVMAEGEKERERDRDKGMGEVQRNE